MSTLSSLNDPNRFPPYMKERRAFDRRVLRLHRLLRQARAAARDLADDVTPAWATSWPGHTSELLHDDAMGYDWLLGTLLAQIERRLPMHLREQVLG